MGSRRWLTLVALVAVTATAVPVAAQEGPRELPAVFGWWRDAVVETAGGQVFGRWP